MKTKSLSTKVAMAMVAGVAVIIAIVFMAYRSHKQFEEVIISQTQQHLLTISRATVISLKEFITNHLNDLQSISKNPLFQEQKREYRLLKIFYEANKEDIDGIYLLDSNGVVLFRYPSKEKSRVGANYSDKPGVAYVLKERKAYVSEVFYSKSGEPSISLSEPIFYEDKLVGIVRLMITLDTISEHFIQPIKVGKKGYIQVFDDNGIILLCPRSEHIGKHIMLTKKERFPNYDWSELEDIVEKMTKGEEGVGTYHSAWWTEEKPEIVKKLTAYAPLHIGSLLWSIGVTMDYSEIAGPINIQARNSFGLAGVVMLVLAIGGGFLFKAQRQKVEFETEATYLKEIAKSAEVLRESEEKYRSVVEGSLEGIIIHQESIVQFTNKAAVKMFGYDKADELMGKNVFEILIDPEHWSELKRRNQILLSGKTNPVHPGWKGIRKDGTRIWIQSSTSPILWKNKPAVLSFCFDVTETKQVGEALHESEGKYRTILENIEDGYYEVDLAGNLTFFNEPLCNMFGYTEGELMGLNYREYMDEENAKKVFEIFKNVFTAEKPVKGIEYTIEKYGIKKEVETSVSLMRDSEGKPIGFRGVIRDITERRHAEEEKKKLQTQLQQVQKMEAVGTLAGGIAHDFNNLLMGIQGNVSLIRLDFDSSHPNYEKLITIENLVQSGSKLTSQLLGYARKGRYEIKPIDLNQLIEESSSTFGRTRKEITIQRELCEDLFAIEVDQGQIEQVLLNIYINAADAMPGGGDLNLKTMNITHEDIKDKLFDPKPGNYVLLTVTDTGVGMDKKTEARIFEPFFTTKEMGRGTGLGLASAYGIIKAHGGYIDVYSEIGEGTTFSIYLHASGKDVAKEKEFSEDIVKGTETVLLVDDEEMIIDVGDKMLKAMGYTVLLAGSGKEALELYEAKKDEISLVMLDMIMPVMGGGETYDRMKEINLNIKVLLSSGYSIDGQAEEILERGCDGFIQKPFNMKELSQKLREILDGKI